MNKTIEIGHKDQPQDVIDKINQALKEHNLEFKIDVDYDKDGCEGFKLTKVFEF